MRQPIYENETTDLQKFDNRSTKMRQPIYKNETIDLCTLYKNRLTDLQNRTTDQ